MIRFAFLSDFDMEIIIYQASAVSKEKKGTTEHLCRVGLPT
jgi:hypothetical protein